MGRTTLQAQYDKWLRSVVKVPKSSKVPLITAYLTLFKHKRKEALRRINRDFKTNYSMPRLREWERGARPLSREIQTYMQRAVIMARFGTVGKDLLSLLNIERSDSDLL